MQVSVGGSVLLIDGSAVVNSYAVADAGAMEYEFGRIGIGQQLTP